LPIGGQADVRLRITEKQEEKRTDSLLFASSVIGVDAAPGEITWQSMTQFQVFGTRFNQLLLNVPAWLEVADVQSSGLESWELTEDPDDGDWTRLTLNFRQPIEGSRAVRLRGVMPMPPEEQWSIPQLRIPAATSHVGRLILTHPPDLRVQILDQAGLRRSSEYRTLDADQPFLVQFPDRSAPQVFEFWQDDFALELVMRSRDRELIANIQNLIELRYERLRYVGKSDWSAVMLRCSSLIWNSPPSGLRFNSASTGRMRRGGTFPSRRGCGGFASPSRSRCFPGAS
jgi:hypothetical protein